MAVRELMAFLFTDLNADKIELHMKATNTKSIGVAEGCGFRKEAHIRERARTHTGEKADLLYYGISRREFSRRGIDSRAVRRDGPHS